MPSLSEHLERHDLAVGPLAFRRDCPLCRAERVAGHLPSVTVAPLRACAAVAAAVFAASAVAPAIVVAADGQGFAAPPPESPPAPQVEDVAVGGGAAAPAGMDLGGRSDPGADRDRPSDPGPRPEEHTHASETGPGAAAAPQDDGGDGAADQQPEGGATPASGAAPTAPSSPSVAPHDDTIGGVRPDSSPRPQTHESPAEPRPARDETMPAPGPSDAAGRRARERTAHERAMPPAVAPRPSADSRPHARTAAGRPTRRGHETAHEAGRDSGTPRAGAIGAPDRDDAERDRADTYVVRPGDSLWRIAGRHLGSHASASEIASEVSRLWELNRRRIGTGDPDLIFPGQTLRL
jgi:nucleoid-associated protein YgaU